MGVIKRVEEREYYRRAGYGESAIGFCTAVLNALSFGFENVKEGEADNGAKHVKCQQSKSAHAIHTAKVQNDSRKNAEADHVAKGIQLNSKCLFIFRTILFRSRNSSVKCIAKTT